MSKWLLFFHLLFAIAWFGGSIYIEALMAGAARTRDPKTIMRTALRVGETNRRLFPVAAIGTVVFGFWLVLDTPAYEFEQSWVVLAIVLAVAVITVSLLFSTPRSAQIEAMVAENGLEDPEAMALARQVGNVGHLITLLLLIALITMIWKPGF